MSVVAVLDCTWVKSASDEMMGKLRIFSDRFVFEFTLFNIKKKITVSHASVNEIVDTGTPKVSIILQSKKLVFVFPSIQCKEKALFFLKNQTDSSLIASVSVEESETSTDGIMTYSNWVELTKGTTLVNYNKDELIYGCDQETDEKNIYQVLRGSVRIEKCGRTVAILGQYQMFGEMSFVDNMKASANCIADEPDVMVAVLSGQIILRKLASDMKLASKFYTYLAVMMADRLSAANRNIKMTPKDADNKDLVASSTDLTESTSSKGGPQSVSCKYRTKNISLRGKLAVTTSALKFSGVIFGQTTEVAIHFSGLTMTWTDGTKYDKLVATAGKEKHTFMIKPAYVPTLKAEIEKAVATVAQIKTSRSAPSRTDSASKAIVAAVSKPGASSNFEKEGKLFEIVTKLSAEDWQLVLEGTTRNKFTQGEVLIAEGSKRCELMYVSRGSVSVEVQGQKVAVLPRGSLIGEITFLNAERKFIQSNVSELFSASATVVANEAKVVVDVIAMDLLLKVFEDHPGFSARFHAYLARHIGARQRNLLALKYENTGLAAQMLNAKSGVPIKQIRNEGTLYPKCFSGKDAVEWLANHNNVDKKMAFGLCQAMLDRGDIVAVEDEDSFNESETTFYYFNEQDAIEAMKAQGGLKKGRSQLTEVKAETEYNKKNAKSPTSSQAKHQHTFEVRVLEEPQRCSVKHCHKGRWIVGGTAKVCTICSLAFHPSCLSDARETMKKKKEQKKKVSQQPDGEEMEFDTSEVKLSIKPKANWEIPADWIKLETQLGQGSFGVVYQATLHGLCVAVKKLNMDSLPESILADFRHEVAIVSSIRHPNCILFMGACTNPENLMLVTEFAGKGTLEDLLAKEQSMSFRKRLGIAKQTALGLNWLHHMTPPFIHRDIKTENILITNTYEAKIADFGLSTFAAQTSGLVGTPFYMAPEVILGKPYCSKVDVFSMAVVLYCLFVYEVPYEDYEFENLDEFLVMIVKGERLSLPGICINVEKLIRFCWKPNPESRPAMSKVVEFLGKIEGSRGDEKAWYISLGEPLPEGAE